MAFKFAVAFDEPGLCEVFKLRLQGVHFECGLFEALNHTDSDFGQVFQAVWATRSATTKSDSCPIPVQTGTVDRAMARQSSKSL